MGRPIPVADKAVAESALISVLENVADLDFTADAIAAELVRTASKVRFQPSTRQLVMTFDLAFSAAEPRTTE